MGKKVFWGILFLGLLAGCSRGTFQGGPWDGDIPRPSKIISTRSQKPPQKDALGVVFVKLASNSLLATAKRAEDGSLAMDEEQGLQIEAEQKAFLQEVAAISPDIETLYRYKFVLNGVALVVPLKDWEALSAKLSELQGVEEISKERQIDPPKRLALSPGEGGESGKFKQNSVRHIGAEKVHRELGLLGAGVRVGIIDSGIDYTHAMFGGPGTPEAYKGINPAGPSEHFPNAKVVGGTDLVGSWPDVPRPDDNPLDESGHGTHVAGTVAGVGDGVNTYSGVAPAASLYAIKVFGQGGTSDVVLSAALEYAADPNRDGDPADRLDVVNMSLGSFFGMPDAMLNRAVKNLSRAGVAVVVSAGNDGDEPYVVSTPSSASEAISVGASVDSSEHNWRFPTVSFALPAGETLTVMRMEGLITRPIPDESQTPIGGKLVFAGLADGDFDPQLQRDLRGNVALIDRGKVSFQEKLGRVHAAGAVGAVVVNNKPGEDAIVMSGNARIDLHAVMIDLETGEQIKAAMGQGEVSVNFISSATIDKPELIDTLWGGTSRGPRSHDSLFKPEVVAPGQWVISAQAGMGNLGVGMSGTSMSAPHVAGLMALLVERFPHLSAKERKDILMNQAKKLMDNREERAYPLPLQGAGLVQAKRAVNATMVASPGAFSLGEVNLSAGKVLRRVLTLRNLSTKKSFLGIRGESDSPGMVVRPDVRIIGLEAGESRQVKVSFTLSNEGAGEAALAQTLEGQVVISISGSPHKVRVPVFGVVRRLSKIKAASLLVRASEEEAAEDALVELTLENKGKNLGVVLPFNLLSRDAKKPSDPTENDMSSRYCDLQAAGYRIIERNERSWLQIGVKLHNPLSHWQTCQVSVQIDTDGDQVPEQEFVGIRSRHLPGLRQRPGHYSMLLDAPKVRQTLKDHESTMGLPPELRQPLDYSSSVVDMNGMTLFGHSTVSIIETSWDKLKFRQGDGQLHIKVAVIVLDTHVVQRDDFLENGEGGQWMEINPNVLEHGYHGLPESISLAPGERVTVDLVKGAGRSALALFIPSNQPVRVDDQKGDAQFLIPEPTFAL